MLKRAGKRLLDLSCDGSIRVVGQAVILTSQERELGLEEKIFPGNQATNYRGRNSVADCGLLVMAALVRGIDAAEALLQREFCKAAGLTFLPGGPVQETRYPHTVDV